MKKLLILFVAVILLCSCEVDNSSLEKEENENYFEVLDLNYNGQALDESFFEIEDISNNGNGTGKAFEVTLKYNVDGDTAYFNTPYDDIYTSSFRFLNMDTEETYKTPEEWGNPASVYTASLLDNAFSIVLQTDSAYYTCDAYNRGLVWVWIQENENDQYQLLNYKVVQQGLASVSYVYDGSNLSYNNITYTNWMYKAENEAKTNKRGMYSNLLDPYWDYDNNTMYTNLSN